MGKRKRKLRASEKAAKKERREAYHTIFINGKMKRVPRPPTIEGMSALSAAGADYLIVGAHALAMHGRPRATGDLAPSRIDLL